MFSDQGDTIGGGQPRFYSPVNGIIDVSRQDGGVAISLDGGSLGDAFGMTFLPPAGERLHTGYYPRAVRSGTSGIRPGIDISGAGRGCNVAVGRFDVKDITYRADGTLASLWLSFEQHCERSPDALFGEVRYREPVRSASLTVAPADLWWPGVPLGAGGTAVPVTLVARGDSPSTIADVTIGGAEASDFSIRLDECTGVSLAPRRSCRVYVRFTPGGAGPRIGSLAVRDGAGRVRRIRLDGYGIGGRTDMVLHSDPGDFVGQGRDYSYSPANADFYVSGDATVLHDSVTGADSSTWGALFQAPAGDVLVPGTTYTGALRPPDSGAGPGMEVTPYAGECSTLGGSFTVNEIAVRNTGSVRSFSVSFEQHCNDAGPALHGTVEYRVPEGDTTPPGPPGHLTVHRRTSGDVVSWTNPSDPDFDHSIVRFLSGTHPAWVANGGRFAYAGSGTSTRIWSPQERPLAVAVFAVDASGNVSRAAVVAR